MAYAFNDDRSKADIYSKDEIDEILYQLSRDVRTSGQYVYVDFTKEMELSIPSTHYTQGACTDGSYIYVFIEKLSGTNVIPGLLKFDLSGTLVDSLYFDSYPNIGHGNSIYYDQVLDCVVVVSSNGYVTEVDADLNVVSHRGQTSGQHFSQFSANESYGFANITGTNFYVLFNRIDDHFFTSYGSVEIPNARASLNILQDICLHGDCLYSVSSSSRRNTAIACIGENGAFVCNYIVQGIDEVEIEGIFVLNNKMYLISSRGLVYTCNINKLVPLTSLATKANPMIQLQEVFSIPNYIYANEITDHQFFVEADVSDNGNGSKILKVQTKVPFTNKGHRDFYADQIQLIYGSGRWGDVYQIATGALRGVLNFCGLTLILNYEISGTHQYLAYMGLRNSSDILASAYFSEDDPDAATKIRSVLRNSTQPFITSYISNGEFLRIGQAKTVSPSYLWLYI